MGILDGKIALITGASRGIGRAIAETLAREGADLALCDLQTEWLADTATAVRGFGRRAECFAVNVSQAADVDAGVTAAVQALGRIDILVNNAGITKDGFLARMSETD